MKRFWINIQDMFLEFIIPVIIFVFIACIILPIGLWISYKIAKFLGVIG